MATEIFVVTSSRALLAVDPQTLSFRDIGRTSVTMTDAAFAPDGTLYGISADALYRIDPATAATTLVGRFGFSGANALEIDATGAAYLASATNGLLHRVDLGTGSLSLVGRYTDTGGSEGDLAFYDGELYLTATNNRLFTIDPATGVATDEARLPVSNLFGLETSGSTLYGFAGNVFYSIDPDTGETVAMSRVGGTGVFYGAASFDFSTPDTDGFTVRGSSRSDWIFGNSGGDRLYGNGGDDYLYAAGGKDTVSGGNGRDTLDGGRAADTLLGGAGNDTLIGGQGADRLYGNAGRDVFVFGSVKDTTVAKAGRDTIFDFSGKGGDRIDLRDIDADSRTTGEQAFAFIGTKAFSKQAGELRYEKKASDTFLYGDVNGDGRADFAIHLDDAVTLSKGYFFA